MSNKINVSDIILGHFRTLRNANGKLSFIDIVTFILIPVFIGIFAFFYQLNLSKDIVSLLVNFGAIFTALLLSVLVLVYDQEIKITTSNSNDSSALFQVRKKLLRQLYYNVSFSVVCAIALVTLCLILALFDEKLSLVEQIVTSLIIAIVASILLNVLMVVKRMHVLLTNPQ